MVAATHVDGRFILRHFPTQSGNTRHEIVDRFQRRRSLKSQRPTDKFSEQPGKTLAGGALQNIRREHVPNVGVRPALSGYEEEAVRQDRGKKLLPRPRSIRMSPYGLMVTGQRTVVAQTARVPEKMRQRHG